MLSRLRNGLLRWYFRTPEHPTKYRIVRFLGRNVCPESGIPARAYPELQLTLHPRDWIEYGLLRGQAYERMTLDFLAANLKPGDVAVMAGVNFGQHVAVAARAVGDDGLVVGVEPQPSAVLRATENLRLNRLQHRVKLVGAALGSKPGFLPMAWSTKENSGAASLLTPGEGMIVPVVPLASILVDLCPRVPRLLLLDVEGFEAQVLAGIGEERLPGIIVVEIVAENLARDRTTPEAIRQRLTGLGYSLFNLEGSEILSDATPLPEANVVALRGGSPVTWSRAALPA